MPERIDRNYHSISDMEQGGANEPWRKFCVQVVGNTKGAHDALSRTLQSFGQKEVRTPEEADYILLICPVASRVGTDVDEALEGLPGGKRTIMVVMHHTFNPDYVLVESRRLVTNPDVRLTVDTLFHEGVWLDCGRNDVALQEITRLLGVPSSQVVPVNNWFRKHRWQLLIGLAVVTGLVILIVILVEKS